MSCKLDINDIIIEMAEGPVTPIAGLTVTESAAILAAIRITVDQSADVITDAGLGLYGLQVSDMQVIGVVKKGFTITNELLECGGVFTGKNGVFTADDILSNTQLQQQMMNELVIANMQNLQAQGIITGDETDQELAGLAGLAAKYLPSEIKSLLDSVGGAISSLLDGIGTVASAAAFALAAFAAGAALIASIKNADILGKLEGFGDTIASIPELATNTIDSISLDAEVDKLVGVPQVPSVSDATASATAASGGLLDSLPSLPNTPALPAVDTNYITGV